MSVTETKKGSEMTLYRREKKAASSGASKIWWLSFTDTSGKRHRVTTGTDSKPLALQFEAQYRADVYRQVKLGESGLGLFSEAVRLFLADKSRKDVVKEYERQLEWWSEQFQEVLGPKPKLKQIDKALILRVIAIKEAEATQATCNRYLSALRACLRLAQKKYDLIDKVPAFFMKVEPKGRVRWITPDEIQRLIAALPEHVRPPMVVALTTGLRRSVVDLLTWDQVDLVRRTITVRSADMKNEEHHVVPLPDLAVEVITQQLGLHDTRVWTKKGKPFRRCSDGVWQKAKAEAGITDFRWHDLRHTWATMLTQAGVPDAVLMMLGCWKSVQMVRKYAHHNVESVRASAELLNATLKGITIPSSLGSSSK